jgi:phosphate transport system protein
VTEVAGAIVTERAPTLEGHTTRAFDGDLSSLHVRAVEMGALVLDQVQAAVTAYADWNRDQALLVRDRERRVNAYDLDVDEEALHVIARRQPMASDLRAVFAIDKIVAELERAGDEAKKLALVVLTDAESRGFRPGHAMAKDVRQLGRLAFSVLRASIECFDLLDASKAHAVLLQDRELDAEYAASLRRIVSRAMEDPRLMQGVIEAAFVMRSLERIGDHARNIARHVLFALGDDALADTTVLTGRI